MNQLSITSIHQPWIDAYALVRVVSPVAIVVVESHRVFAFVAGIDVTAVNAISTAGIAGLTCIVKILSGAAFWKTST
jgi:hypothetical protein